MSAKVSFFNLTQSSTQVDPVQEVKREEADTTVTSQQVLDPQALQEENKSLREELVRVQTQLQQWQQSPLLTRNDTGLQENGHFLKDNDLIRRIPSLKNIVDPTSAVTIFVPVEEGENLEFKIPQESLSYFFAKYKQMQSDENPSFKGVVNRELVLVGKDADGKIIHYHPDAVSHVLFYIFAASRNFRTDLGYMPLAEHPDRKLMLSILEDVLDLAEQNRISELEKECLNLIKREVENTPNFLIYFFDLSAAFENLEIANVLSNAIRNNSWSPEQRLRAFAELLEFGNKLLDFSNFTNTAIVYRIADTFFSLIDKEALVFKDALLLKQACQFYLQSLAWMNSLSCCRPTNCGVSLHRYLDKQSELKEPETLAVRYLYSLFRDQDVTKILEVNPQYLYGFAFRTMKYRLDEFDAALKEHDHALSVFEDDPLILTLRAQLRIEQLKNQSSANQDPSNLALQLNLALEDLNKAIERYPNFAAALGARGIIYAEKRQFDLALTDLNKAIELFPDEHTLRTRGRIYFEQCNDNLALQDLSRAIDLYSHDVASRSFRCEIYIKQGKADLAFQDVNVVMAGVSKKDKPAAYVMRGNIYRLKGDFSAALKDLNYAIDLNANNPGAYRVRSRVYDELDRKEEAFEDKQMQLYLESLQNGQVKFRNYFRVLFT